MRKQYSSQLSKANKPRGKRAVEKWLLSQGWTLTKSKKYEPDWKGTLNGVESWINVEVKNSWTSPRYFPYETIHLPGRWKRFMAKPFINIILNDPLTSMMIVTSSDIVNEITIDTIYTRQEKFFEIPRSSAKVYFRETKRQDWQQDVQMETLYRKEK